jgi:hypothetical protein
MMTPGSGDDQAVATFALKGYRYRLAKVKQVWSDSPENVIAWRWETW